MKKAFLFCMIMLCLTPAWSFTINYFAPSLFTTDMTLLNTRLGITGYQFEDFEDGILTPGLTITAAATISNGYTGSPQTTVHNGTVAPTGWIYSTSIASWSANQFCIYPQVVANFHTFSFDHGISSFGFGIAEIDDIGGPHVVMVNGQETTVVIENLPGFVRSDGRNMYILVDVAPGEVLNSVGLQTVSSVESLFFSHLAFSENPAIGVVPEFNTISCLFIGFVTILIYLRKTSAFIR